jgi:mannitol/fructose-specific phosphotransferase system IIA component (Ntr-type)
MIEDESIQRALPRDLTRQTSMGRQLFPDDRPSIAEIIRADGIVLRLVARDAAGVIRELGAARARACGLETAVVQELLFEREQLASTAIGKGVALPRARMDVPRTIGVLGLAPQGVEFRTPDGIPVQIFVVLGAPRQGVSLLHALALAGGLLDRPAVRRALLDAGSARELHGCLCAMGDPPFMPH